MENKDKTDILAEIDALATKEEIIKQNKLKARDDAELDAELNMLQFVTETIKKTNLEDILDELVDVTLQRKVEEDEVSPSLLIELRRDLKNEKNEMAARILALYKQKVLIQQNIINADMRGNNSEKELPDKVIDALPIAEKKEVLEAKKAYEIIQQLESLNNKKETGE